MMEEAMNDTVISTCDISVSLPFDVAELEADTPVIYVPGAGYAIGVPEPIAWAQFCLMMVEREEVK